MRGLRSTSDTLGRARAPSDLPEGAPRSWSKSPEATPHSSGSYFERLRSTSDTLGRAWARPDLPE
eukprot:1055634-Alexandrium_andersonii.AAC.1